MYSGTRLTQMSHFMWFCCGRSTKALVAEAAVSWLLKGEGVVGDSVPHTVLTLKSVTGHVVPV